jgi:hypothetical protein
MQTCILNYNKRVSTMLSYVVIKAWIYNMNNGKIVY